MIASLGYMSKCVLDSGDRRRFDRFNGAKVEGV